ncbi:MAG: carbohydrate binding domain-containing protein [Bacteroidaceae bacterium]|nr:carbohydrate binding domain-containing protein [Bacteroidaceae bacterium]
MKLHLLACGVLFMLTSTTIHAATPNHPDTLYLFAYHNGPATDGLKLAYSSDGHYWVPMGENHSFFKSDYGTWGAEKRMYDPYTLFDGSEYFTVFSLNQHVNQFGTTRSRDLWLWKPQDYPYMSNQENVARPVLLKQNGQFVVLYTTHEGHYYRTTSTDFQHWSAAEPVTEQAYKDADRTITATIDGTTQTGVITRAPYHLIETLITKAGDAAQRNRLYGESARDDARRFGNVKRIDATLNVHFDQTKNISPHLIGIFFEDINYSADGGLYAELIQNRDFEYSNLDRGEWNAQSFWELGGDGTTWSIHTDHPIHANNSHYAVLTTTHSGAALRTGGFDGIVVKKGEKYDLSLFLKTLDSKNQKLNIRLLDGEKVLAQATFTASSNEWRQHKAVLKPSADATHATLSIEPQTPGRLALDFVSLFPQNTFKGHKNGLRPDLAQTLADLHPRFIRFPGGCVSHGNGLDNMYRWHETVGPLWERKPQSNIWNYHQTKGLGFFEYFQFCEDIGAEPLPVLPAAVPCQNSSRGGAGQQGGLPWDQMDDYAQELINLIEWANGDPKTSPWAKKRAQAGHPKPFNLKYLGIGNEDLISDVFTERYTYLYHRIREAHPEIIIVGTVGPFYEGSDYERGWDIARQEQIPIVDEHYYNSPGWFLHNQNFYDRYDRNGTKVYLGEWASRGNTLENALAEAIHVTNLERNADVVTMASYAPLLAKHGHTQWNPDLIYFNNTDVFPTVNYHVQRLCATNSGTQYVRADQIVETVRDDNGTEVKAHNPAASLRVKTSVVRDEKTGDLILKLVNCTPVATAHHIHLGTLDGYQKKACVSVISGQPADRDNTPVESTLDVAADFTYDQPAYSFSVLRIPAAKR